ncbi:hypothetical protein AB0A81_40265 [Streptomyces flaveolus]|uniref:Uncharacterized protein n=1 Tax=Streptomyces flaveolus TaxID=67297 RepID=A0ABV1VB58_9ACTN|nr:hypothetical protein [Streptomyces solaniscabiei]
MPAPTRLTASQPATYDGPRTAAADFFTHARGGRTQSAPLPFRDGDSASCPLGTEWMRHDGRWIIPGQPSALTLHDEVVTAWWQTRHMPGSKVALVHRLTSQESDLITGDHYTSTFRGLSLRHGPFTYDEPFPGSWLRSLALKTAHIPTVSIHLELPSGIVTLHSRAVGDMFFHPAAPTDNSALCA